MDTKHLQNLNQRTDSGALHPDDKPRTTARPKQPPPSGTPPQNTPPVSSGELLQINFTMEQQIAQLTEALRKERNAKIKYGVRAARWKRKHKKLIKHLTACLAGSSGKSK